jgi:hypothetical protein
LSGVLRSWFLPTIVATLGCFGAPYCAQAAPPGVEGIDEENLAPETWPADWQALPDERQSAPQAVVSDEHVTDEGDEALLDLHADCEEPPGIFWPSPRWLGLRHSSTHGRHIGHGRPLTGTSWRNRPYYVGGDIGTLWITDSVEDNITGDVDLFGGIFAGYDWDHYWGSEFAIHRATPELINKDVRDADRGDRLMIWSASMMYYPWGDTVFRPYWRCGIGVTEVDYPADDGERLDEGLWTVPLGVGLKYPLKRWLAARAEFTDYLALGNNDVSTLHNLSLTLGLEWRFGAHPRSYWPWNPHRHIW